MRKYNKDGSPIRSNEELVQDIKSQLDRFLKSHKDKESAFGLDVNETLKALEFVLMDLNSKADRSDNY